MAYYDVIHNFVSEIESEIPRDIFLVEWVERICEHLKGFPSVNEIVNSDKIFINTLTTIIYYASVYHFSEHYNCYEIRKFLLNKIRIPIPRPGLPV